MSPINRHVCSVGLLFFLWREHDNHAFAFKQGHLFDFAVFFEVVCESEQKHFALFLEED